ncbi:MAG: tripartite tricarboxylate transporter TctB family protein [Rhodospirillales bacterium]
MRKAEIVMGLVMAVFSIYLMWKSAELPIDWIPKKGPGGGAYPFWLSAIMLLSALAIVIRGLLGKTPESRSTEPYMDRQTLKLFAIVAGSITGAIALTHIISMYFAVALFLIFYMRFLGGHSWKTVAGFAILTPVFLFVFFEAALKVTLPKGYVEALFYPIYGLMY